MRWKTAEARTLAGDVGVVVVPGSVGEARGGHWRYVVGHDEARVAREVDRVTDGRVSVERTSVCHWRQLVTMLCRCNSNTFSAQLLWNISRRRYCSIVEVEMPGNGFLHSHSLPFPCNWFPSLPILVPNVVTNSHSHGITIRLFPFLPIPIPKHYIDAA